MRQMGEREGWVVVIKICALRVLAKNVGVMKIAPMHHKHIHAVTRNGCQVHARNTYHSDNI